jgi:hypothetical protein
MNPYDKQHWKGKISGMQKEAAMYSSWICRHGYEEKAVHSKSAPDFIEPRA